MTKLSVNINKIATLRNARGGNTPNVVDTAIKIQEFGGQGITIHPRPDERHITRQDVYDLKPIVTTEYNIEGNPEQDFINLVLEIKPEQVTLVPDDIHQITSNHGWDVNTHFDFLCETVQIFKDKGIRTSIFLDPEVDLIEKVAKTGTDRIELYTEMYATDFPKNPEKAIEKYIKTAKKAKEFGLGINAGHDLSLDNIEYLIKNIPFIDEVSIGHALISEALYLGLENTIQGYLNKIQRAYT